MAISKATIQQARQTDLAQFLLSVNHPIRRRGTRHYHQEHGSLVFTKNAYYWNSRSESGNAVDYLTRHMGMDFESAVAALVDFVPGEFPEISMPPIGVADMEFSKDCRRVIAYLHKARGIDYGLIKKLIDSRHLFQQAEANNAVFPMYDEHGQWVGVELEGTLSQRRFKGITAGSKYGYGFNVRFPNPNVEGFNYVLFFESAIDLVSCIAIQNKKGNSLEACLLVSMAGLKTNVIDHIRDVFPGKMKPILCVDADTAGQEFAGQHHQIKCLWPESGKDWNEALQKLK